MPGFEGGYSTRKRKAKRNDSIHSLGSTGVHARISHSLRIWHLLESPLDLADAVRGRYSRHAEGCFAHVRAVAGVPYGPAQLVRKEALTETAAPSSKGSRGG
jgi:hypothetical protein